MGPVSSLFAQLLQQQMSPEELAALMAPPDDEPDMPMSPEAWAREQALRAKLTAGDDGGPIDLNTPWRPVTGMYGGGR